jgi:hypothetical protein
MGIIRRRSDPVELVVRRGGNALAIVSQRTNDPYS